MNSVLVSLAAFIAAASLLTITPGLDTALVLRTAATGNARGAALAGLGIAFGCFCWAMLVALGMGTLLAASQLAYTTLRWVGAAYLVWTGYKMLRNPRQRFVDEGQSERLTRAARVDLVCVPDHGNAPDCGIFASAGHRQGTRPDDRRSVRRVRYRFGTGLAPRVSCAREPRLSRRYSSIKIPASALNPSTRLLNRS
jgi:hypothetical protein